MISAESEARYTARLTHSSTSLVLILYTRQESSARICYVDDSETDI